MHVNLLFFTLEKSRRTLCFHISHDFVTNKYDVTYLSATVICFFSRFYLALESIDECYDILFAKIYSAFWIQGVPYLLWFCTFYRNVNEI